MTAQLIYAPADRHLWAEHYERNSRDILPLENEVALFSFISLNWKGKPLVSYETVVNLIGGTRTKTGLKVKALLDTNYYETGIDLTPSEMEQIKLRRHKRFPTWNYTISPR